MKISELKSGQGQVEAEVEVIEKGEEREFQKFGKSIRVATITVKDKSGDMKMSLWNDDIDRINVGDNLKISNGYVKEFQGELQLTTGKFGKIEVLGKAEGKAKAKKVEVDVKKEEEIEETEESEETEEVEESIE